MRFLAAFPATLGLLVTLALVTTQTHAEEQEHDTPVCIDVTVDGYKVMSYECLGYQMTNPQGSVAARKNLEGMSVPLAQRAPNQTGLYNQSATRTRMGANFGKSAFPQRPVENVPRSPLLNGR